MTMKNKKMLYRKEKLIKTVASLAVILIASCFALSGCGMGNHAGTGITGMGTSVDAELDTGDSAGSGAKSSVGSGADTDSGNSSGSGAKSSTGSSSRSDTAKSAKNDEQKGVGDMQKDSNYLIAIDAGHQQHANSNKEPIGPGASELKAMVAGGTKGAATGVSEYQLNLDVSLKLENELVSRGYDVLMIRTTNDVDISNAQRAQTANESGADAFVRIHANGSESSSAKGMLSLCQTASNPYNAKFYSESRRLSECIQSCACASTKAKDLGIQETDTMSGINWCSIPVTIFEMGFMTNPEEDRLMQDEDYQYKIACGIADGIDRYFGN